MEPLLDRLGRPLETLRISITDRCNFRCVYCMPKEVFGRDYAFLERRELLTFEELARVAGIFAGLGVRTLRITGGEPLVRRNVEHLVELLSAIETPDGGRLELALTTNGSVLAQKAEALAAAGLSRVTVSLDSLDDQAFRAMNDVDFPVQKVLEGIDASPATRRSRSRRSSGSPPVIRSLRTPWSTNARATRSISSNVSSSARSMKR